MKADKKVLSEYVLGKFRGVSDKHRARLVFCALETSLEQYGPIVALARLAQIMTFCRRLNISSLEVDEESSFFATMTQSIFLRGFPYNVPCYMSKR